jgi:hypothetical protein
MKVLIKLLAFAVSILSCSAAATYWGPYLGQGGYSNYMTVGIMVTNTTLNAGLYFCNSLDQPLTSSDMAGMQVFRWDPANQNWQTSSYYPTLGGWVPNRTIAAGDALYIRYNTNSAQTDCWNQFYKSYHVYQYGVPFVGTITNVIKPGWNLIANGSDGDLSVGVFQGTIEQAWILGGEIQLPCEETSAGSYGWQFDGYFDDGQGGTYVSFSDPYDDTPYWPGQLPPYQKGYLMWFYRVDSGNVNFPMDFSSY